MPRRRKSRQNAAGAAPGQPRPRRSRACILSNEADKISFGDLAIELRAMIYKHALTLPNDGTLDLNRRGEPPKAHIPAKNLLVTCKAINEEATRVLYGHNTFRIDVLSYDTTVYNPPAEREKKWARPSQWNREATQPFLNTRLKRIKPQFLGTIRHLEFAFHGVSPFAINIPYLREPLFFPDKANFTVRVDLLPRAPYFKLSFVAERSHERLDRRIEGVLERFTRDLQADFVERGLRSLARQDIRDLAFCMQTICDTPRARKNRTLRL